MGGIFSDFGWDWSDEREGKKRHILEVFRNRELKYFFHFERSALSEKNSLKNSFYYLADACSVLSSAGGGADRRRWLKLLIITYCIFLPLTPSRGGHKAPTCISP